MNPFLKWPGGKRWFIAKYNKIFPEHFNRYIEPFLGSAATFFYIEPDHAIISDTNSELINLYCEMRDHPLELARLMQKHDEKHCTEYYYSVRSQLPVNPIDRAARTLYLNRTCYNGMYRVNKKGEFNVPIGTKTACAFDIDSFPKYASILKKADISACDFQESISHAEDGDLLFVDPPYAISKGRPFIGYNDNLFSWNDQIRLLQSLCEARDRGVQIIATNSSNSQIVDMYQEKMFCTHALSRHCVIAADPSKRTTTEELLITSFDLTEDFGVI